MKARSIVPLFCMAALVIGCAVLDPAPDAEIGRSVEEVPTDPSALTGEEIYRNECTACHNADGSPVDRITVTDLRNYQGTYQKFDSTLNEGPGAMPIFTYQQLDTSARLKLYNHVRSF